METAKSAGAPAPTVPVGQLPPTGQKAWAEVMDRVEVLVAKAPLWITGLKQSTDLDRRALGLVLAPVWRALSANLGKQIAKARAEVPLSFLQTAGPDIAAIGEALRAVGQVDPPA